MICVLYFFAACSAPENKSVTLQQAPSTPTKIVNNGKRLFEDKCSVCHGSDGAAGIANAADLQASRLDTASTLNVITRGKKSMPAFSDQLDKGEIEQVTNYVFSLKKKD